MTHTSDSNDEFLDKARRYLAQQEDLFGEIVVDRAKQDSGVTKQDSRVTESATAPSKLFDLPDEHDEQWTGAADLADLNSRICNCLKCGLGHTRTKFVFGTGNPHADVMFVGEAPGADEDAQGEPFVGRAGQLLNKIIEATGYKRSDVYICNIIKCRPPENRAPLPEESTLCSPYLMKQIELVNPKFIICLGRTAAQWLLQTTEGLSALRGRIHNFMGRNLIVTYHPAALLRNPAWKAPTWDDMKMFMNAMKEINELKGGAVAAHPAAAGVSGQ